MTIEIDSETSRIRATLVNSGRYSFEEADRALAESRLLISVADEVAQTPAGQAAFLTAVATASRCFGNVHVRGCLDAPLVLPLQLALDSLTLGASAKALGAKFDGGSVVCRSVLIGQHADATERAVQTFWDGWTLGVAPGEARCAIGRGDCPLAGVAAGALGVGQAFLAEQGDPRAGKIRRELSLWGPRVAHDPGPEIAQCRFAREFWLIGLGNLGQAYLWSLSVLPYSKPEEVVLFLQDDDIVRKENWGTSILVQRPHYGELKTRVAEGWATRRRFQARRLDRRLDEHLQRAPNEPGIALAGLDRMPPRRLLGKPGFEYVIDTGLGATVADYAKFRINTFDRNADPARHFEGVEDESRKVADDLLGLKAYQELARTAANGGCGNALLAGQSVAVPFVSAFAAALAVTQTIQIATGDSCCSTLTGDLRDVATISVAVGRRPERLRVATAAPGRQWHDDGRALDHGLGRDAAGV